MKTTARILSGLISVVLSCSTGVSLAAPPSSIGNNASTTTADASQTGSYRPEEARRRCDDLLLRTRQAMAENDLRSAQSLLAQADALGVEYGTFYRGDTPKKVRRDLERTLKAASTGSARPSQLFSPLSFGKNAPSATDPFAARNNDSGTLPLDAKSRAKSCLLNGRKELAAGNLAAAAHWYRQAAEQRAAFGPGEDSPTKLAAEILRRGGRLDESSQTAGTPGASNVRPLPPVGAVASPTSDSHRAGSAAGSGSALAGRNRSDQLLLAARRSLSEGDVQRARIWVEQAKALGLSYGPSDDSPTKVETILRVHSDLMAQKAERGETEGYRSQYARLLMQEAEGLLQHGDYNRAEQSASLALRQRVSFGPYQPNPEELLKRIASARRQDRMTGSRVVGVSGQEVLPATGNTEMGRAASHAVYDQSNDRSWNMLAGAQQPTPAPPLQPSPGLPVPSGMTPAGGPSVGESLFQQGETALRAHDKAKALDYFRQAANYSGQLNPVTAQRLQERLQMLSTGGGASPAPSMIDKAAQAQRSLYQQVAVEVAHQESEAEALRQADPKGALARLEETRRRVETAGLEAIARDRLLARLDRSLAEMQQYIDQNRARIDLEDRSQRTREDIERERQVALDVQQKLALLVEEYNQLMEEQRYAEAEVAAKRAAELDPDNPLTQQLLTTSRLVRHHLANVDLRGRREEGFWHQMQGVDEAAVPFDDLVPYIHGDVREWEALTERRLARAAEHGRRRTEAELEIEQKLKTPVLLEFENAPLAQVMDYLAGMAAVNLHLDPQGLENEGISTDDPVTINLSQEISLKSALNLILEPLHLSYVIKDEVLKITSEQYRDGELVQYSYNVADLVIPIPNFVPSTGMGLAGAYHDALGSVGFGGHGPFGGVGSPLAVVASRSGAQNNAMVSPTVLAQMASSQSSAMSTSTPSGFGGPGGLGGGAMADFDSLIELITTTVSPESWDDVGGPGSIAPFETNLSLVVSQTQEVHDQLVDLLEQLRRMQDLQVTIEVRFITLNDNFFERIGIDFDFDIDDDIDRPFQVFGKVVGDDDDDVDPNQEPLRDTRDVDHDRALTVGLQQPGVFSADLDIPFTQNSFGLAVPQFGGFDATAGAQLGFAILSDIEAFFFINAAQGDRRSNVLQAPKVTLFNGQQAYVSDTSQSPFVISVIPVVGDFAAAQQPVIVVLSEGTMLTVQAVVSDDRRFVRLTVVPFFSTIRDVDTFQFEGSSTTTVNTGQTGNQDDPDEHTSSTDAVETSRSGTTVQLPTFSFVTVTTTVSVPDGGTVLLGGIKRLNEGRNEFGVPILNKVPYINRLFKNVGIGRETQSLMMMVTPRIIIQEEEEEQLGILQP